MAKSKLYEIIASFTPVERDRFQLFLKSPYFVENGSEDMENLFLALLNSVNNGQGDTPDKAYLHERVFQDKAFSEARIVRALTRLYKLVEQFLKDLYYHRSENSHQQSLDLAVIFRDRSLLDLYEKQLSYLKKAALEYEKESPKSYWEKYQIAREVQFWEHMTNTGDSDLAITDLLENLDLFYHTEVTEMINRILLQQKLGVPTITPTIQHAIDSNTAPSHLALKSPLLAIRQKTREAFSDVGSSRENFETLAKLIKEHEGLLDEGVLGDTYALLRSYCSYLISIGHLDMYETLHDLQLDNLKRGYFFYNGYINPTTLLNITRTALILKKVQWAREFIVSLRQRITNEGPEEEIYNLNLALCLFEEKKYEQILPHIMYAFYSKVYFLTARRLELRVYYEQRSDLLPFKMEAFRKHIERMRGKKASNHEYEGNNNFLNILLQLSKSAQGSMRSIRIFKRIMEENLVAERLWLAEKARELSPTTLNPG